MLLKRKVKVLRYSWTVSENCQQTVRSSANPVEQAVIQQEADRRLLAAFINGLVGIAGKQVKMQMPDNIDRASNKSIIATNAAKEEKALLNREDRGSNCEGVHGRRQPWKCTRV